MMTKREKDGMIKGKCRSCGLIIVLEPAKKISRHEAPACPVYLDLCKDADRIADVEIGADGWPKDAP